MNGKITARTDEDGTLTFDIIVHEPMVMACGLLHDPAQRLLMAVVGWDPHTARQWLREAEIKALP
jgi:hypothetical protein